MQLRPLKLSVLVISGVLCCGGIAAAAQGPDPSGSAQFGLCKAYVNVKGHGTHHKHDAVAFQALKTAATNAGETVAEFCANATPGHPATSTTSTSSSSSTTSTTSSSHGAAISNLAQTTDSTGVDKGATISGAASNGKSQAGQHGKP